MTIAQFDAIVEDAISEVPEPLRQYLDTVLIGTLPNPTPRQRAWLGPDETVYGLYEGHAIPQRLHVDASLLPPSTITLFRIPLRRDFPGEAELIREIRRTLFHELAHHFGIDDDSLEAWGVY